MPPAGARRLNLILAGKPAGGSASTGLAKPATTMTGTVLTPGEHYLHGVACRLLCGDPPTRGIGAAIDALLAADALAADSAVPGQLAALCKRLPRHPRRLGCLLDLLDRSIRRCQSWTNPMSPVCRRPGGNRSRCSSPAATKGNPPRLMPRMPTEAGGEVRYEEQPESLRPRASSRRYAWP